MASATTENFYQELEVRFEELKKNSAKSADQAADDNSKDAGDNTENVKSTQKGLQDLLARLDEILSNVKKDDQAFVKLLSMKSSLLYERAKIALNLNDYAGCQSYLEKALNIIEDLSDHPQITYLYLRLMNHLAYVLSRQGNLQVSKDALEKITEMKPGPDVLVYSTEELFSQNEIDQTDAALKLYRLNINNLQMLGWVCSKMGLELEYAAKQHTILQYQLTFGECDPVDWASRCARLAVLYMSKFKWVAARYHLSTASSMLDQLERDMVPHPDLGKAQAEIARGWIYYGIRLFDASKTIEINKRCAEIFSYDPRGEGTSYSAPQPEEETLDPELVFVGCEVKIEDIPSRYISNSEDARMLFFQTHLWLKRARMFYTLRDHPYIYVNCILDLSELYRFLAYFEPDLESQYNVQKRRADALETLSGLLKDVRPQCYLSVSVEILRELAEVHLELMGLNLKRIYHVQGVVENQGNLKKRMEAVSDIQARLERFGSMTSQKAQGEAGHPREITTHEEEDEDVKTEPSVEGSVVSHRSSTDVDIQASETNEEE